MNINVENLLRCKKAYVEKYILRTLKSVLTVIIFELFSMNSFSTYCYAQSITTTEGRRHLSVHIDADSYVVHEENKDDNKITVLRIISKLEKISPRETLSDCGHAIDISIGGPNQNMSSGISCKITKDSMRFRTVCDDKMFGHFSLGPTLEREPSIADLAIFTATKCFGG